MVLLLWFLTVTCSCCPYLYVGSLSIIWLTFLVKFMFWQPVWERAVHSVYRVPFVNCCQFMYLVISLLVLRAGYGIWLYQFFDHCLSVCFSCSDSILIFAFSSHIEICLNVRFVTQRFIAAGNRVHFENHSVWIQTRILYLKQAIGALRNYILP